MPDPPFARSVMYLSPWHAPAPWMAVRPCWTPLAASDGPAGCPGLVNGG